MFKNNKNVPEQLIIWKIKRIKLLFLKIAFKNNVKNQLTVLKEVNFKEFHVINVIKKKIHNYKVIMFIYYYVYVYFNDIFK